MRLYGLPTWHILYPLITAAGMASVLTHLPFSNSCKVQDGAVAAAAGTAFIAVTAAAAAGGAFAGVGDESVTRDDGIACAGPSAAGAVADCFTVAAWLLMLAVGVSVAVE